MGRANLVSGKRECKAGYCANPAVIALESHELCLDHFFALCYECLDRLELLVRSRSLEATDIVSARALLVECSNFALFISLRHERLSNLDRSRLLNILLLSEDLQSRLR